MVLPVSGLGSSFSVKNLDLGFTPLTGGRSLGF